MKKQKAQYHIMMKNMKVPIISVDYNKLSISDNKILRSTDTPILRAQATEQICCFEYSWIDIRHIGCKYASNQIIEKWTELIQQEFLLEDIAERLTTADCDNHLKFPEYYIGKPENHKELRVLPSWHHLVRLVDLCLQIENCEAYNKISRFEQRMDATEKELNEDLNGDVGILYKRTISLISELVFIGNLCTFNINWNKLELPKKGSDFQIDLPFIREKKIEVKTKIDEINQESEPYIIEELSIPALLLYYAQSSTSEKALNKQAADIEIVNLSYCYCALLFRHVDPTTKKGNLSLEYAFNEAIELIKNGNKAILLFVELYAPFRILAQTIDAKFLEVGREFIDNIRNILKKKWWGIGPTSVELMKIMDAITKLEHPINEDKIIAMISKSDSSPHEIAKIINAIRSV